MFHFFIVGSMKVGNGCACNTRKGYYGDPNNCLRDNKNCVGAGFELKQDGRLDCVSR